jgi:hypothetical protein
LTSPTFVGARATGWSASWPREDLREQRREHALAATRRLQKLTTPLNDALRDVHPRAEDVHPRAEVDTMGDRYTQNILRTLNHAGAPEIDFRFQRMSQIASGPEHFRYALRMGRGLELTADETLIFRAYIDVGYPRVSGTDYQWLSEPRTAPVGSVQAEAMLEDGTIELAARLREALEIFVERLPQDDR